MRTLRPALLLALASCALSAHAVVIDFEDLAGTGANASTFTVYGPSVVSGGFRFGGTTLTSTKQGDSYNYTGSIALYDDPGSTTTMTRVGGGAFSLNGIALANVFRNPVLGGSTVTFTGTLRGGGSVFQSFTLAADDPGLQAFAFSGFSDVTSVSWEQSPPFHEFDNIDVTPLSTAAVPGPVAALPFALIAFKRRKRKA